MSLQHVLRTLYLVIVSLQDLITASEDRVLQSEGFIQVSDYCRVGPDQSVVRSPDFVVKALQLVP